MRKSQDQRSDEVWSGSGTDLLLVCCGKVTAIYGREFMRKSFAGFRTVLCLLGQNSKALVLGTSVLCGQNFVVVVQVVAVFSVCGKGWKPDNARPPRQSL
jgi:hypothetical protein